MCIGRLLTAHCRGRRGPLTPRRIAAPANLSSVFSPPPRIRKILENLLSGWRLATASVVWCKVFPGGYEVSGGKSDGVGNP